MPNPTGRGGKGSARANRAATRDHSLAATEAELSGPDARGVYRFGKWSIHYDPPPIPIRSCDWQFSHDNFDASYEGEEDGWVGNGLCGSAASLEAAIEEIKIIDEDRA